MVFNRIGYKQYRCQSTDTKLTPTDGAGSTLVVEDRELTLKWTGLFWRPIFAQSPSKGVNFGRVNPTMTTLGSGGLSDLLLIGTVPSIVFMGSQGSKQMAQYLPLSAPGQRGWKAVSNNPTTVRQLNPYLSCKIRVGTTIDVMRFYVGWMSTNVTIGSTDTPLANLHGLLVGYRDQDSFYQIFHNGGLASEPAPISTGTSKAISSSRTIEIIADDATPKFSVSVNGGALVNVTTDIPATTQELYFHFIWELVSGTTTHSIYHIGTEFFDGL